MKDQHFYIDGSECKEGDCLKKPDHHVQTLEVTIRSSASAITPDALKDLIQSKYEVMAARLIDRTTYHPK